MLNKFKFKVSKSDYNINIPLTTDNNAVSHVGIEKFIENEVEKSINKIISVEKESYTPVSGFKLIYKFYYGSYRSSFENAGFRDDFINKNNFKKSLFLLEFYDKPTVDNTLLFNMTLNVNPNPEYGKGCDIETKVVRIDVNGVSKFEAREIVSPSFTVQEERNELFFIYYKRDITDLKNFKSEGNLKYISLYMKSMFLNAATGKAHYFINITDDSIIPSKDFNTTLHYFEVRFYDNQTYAFYKDNIKMNNIILREVATK